jgi:hypothetical protein
MIRHLPGLVALTTVAVAPSIANGQQAPASPLAAYPGFGHSPAADEARYRREQASRERRIASCMRDKGLAYVAEAPLERTQAQTPDRRHASARPVDQNERHAASLSPSQRAAYYMALYGVPDPNDDTAKLWKPGSPTGGGCWGDALRAIPGVYSARSALAGEFADMRRSIVEHPAVKTAEQSWQTCMRAQGLDYESPRAFYQRIDPLTGPPAAAAEADGTTKARTVAAECRTKSGLDTAAAQARSAREAEFVAAHGSRLEAFRARLEAQPPLD